MALGFPNKIDFRRLVARLTILTVFFTGLQLSDISGLSPAQASDPVSGYCRSTDGTGTTRETDATKNGFYTSLASRASDSIDGLIIRPVFSKRMYVDYSKNFDATYIAYQIENTTTTAYTNAVINLSGFTGTAIQPVTSVDSDATVTIPAKSSGVNGKVTAYFMMRATSTTDVFQRHDVRVLTSAGAQLAGCYTEIEGVQRSLSASANKVTAISVSPSTLALDQTFTVEVTGAPGKIGAGSGPDASVMAFSPGSSSSWPTMAIRLEGVSFVLRGFNGNSSAAACEATGATTNNSTKSATWTETLVIRNFASCADTNKHTYVATYTFRLIGSAASNPVVRPLSSIASGTQVKYTGTLPSVDVTVPITVVTKPSVAKTASACTTTGAAAGKMRVPFTITVTMSTGTTSLDKIRDVPTASSGVVGTFISGTFTDVNNTSSTTLQAPTITTVSGTTYWDFAPLDRTIKKFAVSSSRNIVLNYTVEVPIPAAGSPTINYSNKAYALYGDMVVGSGDNVVGVSYSLTSSSASNSCTYTPTSDPKPKEPQAITFSPPTSVGAGSSTVISAYSDSTLPVTLSSDTPSDCSVTLFNGLYTLYAITEGATCSVTATQSGNSTFDAATPVQKNITILKGQVISYTAGIFNTGTTTTVKVWATSKLQVSLISIDTSICTVAGTPAIAYSSSTGETTYTINKVGTSGSCILTASQGGDSTWGPAPPRDILIGVGTTQSINFSTPANATTYKSPDVSSFLAKATAMNSSVTPNVASGNPVYFKSTTPAVCAVVQAVDSSNNAVSGYDSGTKETTVTVNIVSPGTCILTADQDGLTDAGLDSGFASAAQVSKTVSITGTGSTAQSVSFTDPGSKTYGDTNFNVTSISRKSSDSSATGLLVALATTTSSVCELGTSTLSGNNSIVAVKLLAAGTCTITGNQAGDNTYAAATQATLNITVNAKPLTISGLSPTKIYDGNTDITDWGGTATLAGVVVGDGVGEIALAGTHSGSYGTKTAETGKSITVTGYSLTGSKTSSYTLASSFTVTGEITKRQITVKYSDVTKTTTDSAPTCATSEVSLSVGTLVATESLFSVSCSGIPGSMSVAGNYTVTPSSAVIKASGTDLSANYNISYATGVLTITAKTVPTLEAQETTIVYGSLQDTLTEDSSSTSSSRVKGKDGSTLLAGTISHKKLDGSAISGELPVGDYTFDVEFTPTDNANYANKQGQRVIHIVKRKLRISGVTAVNKVYDGGVTATVSGTAVLEADPVATGKTLADGYGLGVYSTDDVTLDSSVTIEFSSETVGTSKSVTYTRALAGTKAGNYDVSMPSGLVANIIARKLTYSVTAANKVYDGTTSATVTASNDSLTADPAGDGGGVVPGDDVTLTGTATGSFTSANVGGSVGVTVSGRSLDGTKKGNYTLTHPAGVTAQIISRKLKVAGLTGVNKVYDGSRTASVSGTASLAADPVDNAVVGKDSAHGYGLGLVDGESSNVSLTGTPTIEFSSADAGTSISISHSGLSLTGSKSGNYELAAASGLSANIIKRKLRVAGISAVEKVYDGTTAVSLTGDATLETDPVGSGKSSDDGYGWGIVSGESGSVSLTGTAVTYFNSANAGSDVTVTYTGKTLTGSKAHNYDLADPTGIKANIITRKLRIAGLHAVDKVYDGDTSAAVSGSATLEADPVVVADVNKSSAKGYGSSGVLAGDSADVTISGSATVAFTSADANSSGTSVTYSGQSLSGSKAANYQLAMPSGLAAIISKRKLTVSGLSGVNKQYDGNRTATVSGTATLAPFLIADGGNSDGGVVTADIPDVTLDGASTATYEFASKDVGTSRGITMSGKTLAGSKSSNYSLHSPAGLGANITQRPLKLGTASKSKFQGASDPSLGSYSLLDGTTFASGENATTIGGITVERAAGETIGAHRIYALPKASGYSTARDNYNITVLDSSLYIAKATITTTQAGGFVTLPQVDCGCEGFKPGATVTLELHSTPQVLDTATVEPDGTCPLLSGTIPDGTTGSHDLVIVSEFPNSDPLTYTNPITLASVTPSSSPSPSASASPSPSASASPSPSSTSTPSPSPSAPGNKQKLSVFVWLDLNADGIQDTDEPDLPGLTVRVSQAPITAALVKASVRVVTNLISPVAAPLIATALADAKTDVDGFVNLDSVDVGDWLIKAMLPSKLSSTKDSDSAADSQILAVISSGLSLDAWMGVNGHSIIDAPIYGSDGKPADKEIEIVWEGLDEDLLTWDDVHFEKDPITGALKMTGMPSGNYRLIRVGSTPAKSECVDIVLEEYKTFTAKIITQKSALCYVDPKTIKAGAKTPGKQSSGGLAETGAYLLMQPWTWLSFGLIAAGSAILLRPRKKTARRRKSS